MLVHQVSPEQTNTALSVIGGQSRAKWTASATDSNGIHVVLGVNTLEYLYSTDDGSTWEKKPYPPFKNINPGIPAAPFVVDPQDYIYQPTQDPLPSKKDLSIYVMWMENQGYLNSCTGNAVTTACEMYLLANHPTVFADNLSRRFVYYLAREKDSLLALDGGAYLRTAIASAHKVGICYEYLCPYIDYKYNEKPIQDAYDEAATLKLDRYELINTNQSQVNYVLALKSAVNQNYPVVFSFDATSTFSDIFSTVSVEQAYFDGAGIVLGGHAAVIVGYDDALFNNQGGFICCNSYGANWGYKGYFTVPYSFMGLKCLEAWVLIGFKGLTIPEPPVPATYPKTQYTVEPRKYPTIRNWVDIKYLNGSFFLISSSRSPYIYKSLTGVNWVEIDTGAIRGGWNSIHYNGTTLCLVSNTRDTATSTDNGNTWQINTNAIPVTGGSWGSMCVNGTRFFAVSSTGESRLIYSDDGIAWTLVSGESLPLDFRFDIKTFAIKSEALTRPDTSFFFVSGGVTYRASVRSSVAIATSTAAPTASKYFISYNGGLSWETKLLPLPTNVKASNISSITVENGVFFMFFSSEVVLSTPTRYLAGLFSMNGLDWHHLSFVKENGSAVRSTVDNVSWSGTEYVFTGKTRSANLSRIDGSITITPSLESLVSTTILASSFLAPQNTLYTGAVVVSDKLVVVGSFNNYQYPGNTTSVTELVTITSEVPTLPGVFNFGLQESGFAKMPSVGNHTTSLSNVFVKSYKDVIFVYFGKHVRNSVAVSFDGGLTWVTHDLTSTIQSLTFSEDYCYALSSSITGFRLNCLTGVKEPWNIPYGESLSRLYASLVYIAKTPTGGLIYFSTYGAYGSSSFSIRVNISPDLMTTGFNATTTTIPAYSISNATALQGIDDGSQGFLLCEKDVPLKLVVSRDYGVSWSILDYTSEGMLHWNSPLQYTGKYYIVKIYNGTHTKQKILLSEDLLNWVLIEAPSANELLLGFFVADLITYATFQDPITLQITTYTFNGSSYSQKRVATLPNATTTDYAYPQLRLYSCDSYLMIYPPNKPSLSYWWVSLDKGVTWVRKTYSGTSISTNGNYVVSCGTYIRFLYGVSSSFSTPTQTDFTASGDFLSFFTAGNANPYTNDLQKVSLLGATTFMGRSSLCGFKPVPGEQTTNDFIYNFDLTTPNIISREYLTSNIYVDTAAQMSVAFLRNGVCVGLLPDGLTVYRGENISSLSKYTRLYQGALGQAFSFSSSYNHYPWCYNEEANFIVFVYSNYPNTLRYVYSKDNGVTWVAATRDVSSPTSTADRYSAATSEVLVPYNSGFLLANSTNTIRYTEDFQTFETVFTGLPYGWRDYNVVTLDGTAYLWVSTGYAFQVMEFNDINKKTVVSDKLLFHAKPSFSDTAFFNGVHVLKVPNSPLDIYTYNPTNDTFSYGIPTGVISKKLYQYADNLYAYNGSKSVAVSSDAENWSILYTFDRIVIDFCDFKDSLYALTDYSVYKSDDLGLSWSVAYTFLKPTKYYFVKYDDKLFVYGYPAVYTNDGISFTSFDLLFRGGKPPALKYSATISTGGSVYASFSNTEFKTTYLLKTTNNGSSFDSIKTGLTTNITGLGYSGEAVFATGELLPTKELEYSYTLDGGVTWVTSSISSPQSNVIPPTSFRGSLNDMSAFLIV